MTKTPPAQPPLKRPAPETLRDTILATLDRMKGEETLTIDLNEKSDVAAYMILSSGQSTTKVGAMAMEVRKDLKALGAEILNVDGTGNKDWVLIDANDCVVHLFRPPVRAFYNLERLWAPELQQGAGQNPLAEAAAKTADHPEAADLSDHPLSLATDETDLEELDGEDKP